MSFSPALVIGIGGAGKLVCLSIKKALIERFGDPNWPGIQFHVFDTDTASPTVFLEDKKTEVSLTVGAGEAHLNEVTVIPCGDDITGFQRAAALNPEGYADLEEWWPGSKLDNPLYGAQGRGAAMTGAFGRLMLHNSEEDILDKVKRYINRTILHTNFLNDIQNSNATKKLGNINLNDISKCRVYLVGSLCGGTGRGTFLDIALQLSGDTRFDLIGIFLTPTFYLENDSIEGGRNRTAVNFYRALQEIDLFQSAAVTDSTHPKTSDIKSKPFGIGGLAHSERYEFKNYQNKTLFSELYVIDKYNEKISMGEDEEGIQYATEMIANFIMGFQCSMMESFNSNLSNIQNSLLPKPINALGREHFSRLGSIGFQGYYLPRRDEATAYLAHRLSKIYLDWILGPRSKEDEFQAKQETVEWEDMFKTLKEDSGLPDSKSWRLHPTRNQTIAQKKEELLKREHTKKEGKDGAEGFLEEAAELDQLMNEDFDLLHSYGGTLEKYFGFVNRWKLSFNSGAVDVSTLESNVSKIIKKLEAEIEELYQFNKALKKHLDSNEKGARRTHFDRAKNQSLELDIKWVEPFDVDADRYIAASFSRFTGYNNPFKFPNIGQIEVPGSRHLHMSKVVKDVIAKKLEEIKIFYEKIKKVLDCLNDTCEWISSKSAMDKYCTSVKPFTRPWGGVVSNEVLWSLMAEKLFLNGLEKLGGKEVFIEISKYVAENNGNNYELSKLILGDEIGEVSCGKELAETVIQAVDSKLKDNLDPPKWTNDEYMKIDIFPILAASNITPKVIEDRATPWIVLDPNSPVHNSQIRKYKDSYKHYRYVAVSGSGKEKIGTLFDKAKSADILRASDRPGIEYAVIAGGFNPAAIGDIVKWRKIVSGVPNHIGHLDKRLFPFFSELTPDLVVLCQAVDSSGEKCGHDNTVRFNELLRQGITLERCVKCNGYIDGSWECTGIEGKPHSSQKNSPDQEVCGAELGGYEYCDGRAPWLKLREWCWGCARAIGKTPDTTKEEDRLYEVDPTKDTCPKGHLTVVRCPICEDPQCINGKPEANLLNRKMIVYKSKKARCFSAAGNAPWACCPVCGYPMAADQHYIAYDCPRCRAKSYVCPECNPKDPFRLVEQKETSYMVPDPSLPATCPVHNCNCVKKP